MSRYAFAAALAGAAALAVAGAAQAQETGFQPLARGTLVVHLRATAVVPDNASPIVTATGGATGLDVHVGRDYMPTLGFDYFVADNLSVELIAGATRHDIRAVGASTSTLVSRQWVIPPTLTAKYHLLPDGRVSPYVGAGVNYMLFVSRAKKNGYTVDLDNGFGWALQAGADVATVGPWQLNLDAKKIFFRTDATINGGALKSRVKLDPWVVSVGVGRRF
jgi:outer membrane protein